MTPEYRRVILKTINVIENPQKFKKNNQIVVVPIETGGGKSTITNLTLSYLAKDPVDLNTLGTIILKERIEDCNDTAAAINSFSGKDIAIAYHSGVNTFDANNPKVKFISDKKLLDSVRKHPIVVMTHEGFKRRYKSLGEFIKWTTDNSLPPSSSIESAKDLYIRKRLIIDEQPTLMETFKLTEEHLSKLEAHFRRLGNTSFLKQVSTVCSYIRNNCFVKKTDQKNQYYDKCDFSFSTEVRKYFKDIKNYSYIDIFVALDIFCTEGGFVNYSDNEHFNYLTVAKYVDIFDPSFDAIILDGTAKINCIYENSIYSLVDIPSIKTYKNTTIRVCRKLSGSARELSQNTKIIGAALNYTSRIIPKNEEGVLFTLKAFKDKFSTIGLSDNLQINHFGNITGTNIYKDCRYLFLIGTPFMFDSAYKHVYHLYNQNINYCRDDSCRTINGVRHFVDSDYNRTKNSVIATELVQAINRSSCRYWVKGDTFDTYVFMLCKDDEIIKLIQKAMPGVKVVYDYDFYSSLPKNTHAKRNTSSIDVLIEVINKHEQYFDRDKIRKKELFDCELFSKVLSKPTRARLWQHPIIQQFEDEGKIRTSKNFIEFLEQH